MQFLRSSLSLAALLLLTKTSALAIDASASPPVKSTWNTKVQDQGFCGTTTVFTTLYVTATSPSAPGSTWAAAGSQTGSSASSGSASGSSSGSMLAAGSSNAAGVVNSWAQSGSSSSSGSASGGSSDSWSAVGSPVSALVPYDGGAASGASSANSTFGSGRTLLPAVHWDHPVDDIENLAPGNSTRLYFTSNGVSDPSVAHLFASLDTTLQYETVILDHSSYVSNTVCDASGITVSFSSAAAFKYACTAWSIPQFVLVTYMTGCGTTQDQRTFWLINGITIQQGTNSILASVVQEIAIEDALDGVDMVWGHYTPGSNTTSGVSGSASAANGTSGGVGSSGNSGSTLNGTNAGSTASSGSVSTFSNSTTSSGNANGNGTSATYAGAACGAAPSATIDGFPAFACGDPNFDQDIDAAIGFFDFSSADYAADAEDFAPGVAFNSTDLTPGATEKRALVKRCGTWIPCFIANAAKSLAKGAVQLASGAKDLASAALNKVPALGNLVAAVSEFDPTISGNKDINLGPDNSADSPWGKAATIYQADRSSDTGNIDVTLYCVNCGIKGSFQLHGAAKWNLRDGLHALNAQMNANMEAGLNLGLVANAAYHNTKTKQLIRAPIPDLGVAVKGVFSAGVYCAVDAVATLDISAQGQVLIGGTLTWPNFQASLNLLDQNSGSQSSITGYTPELKKTFEASGSVTIQSTLSLPISLNVGVEIVPLSYKKTMALIEEPGVVGKITAAGSTANAPTASETCNNGIEYSAALTNDVKFDFFGLKTFTLNHLDLTLIPQTCKQFGSSASPTTSATTGIDGTATATDSNTATGTETTSATGTDTTSADATATPSVDATPTPSADTTPTSDTTTTPDPTPAPAADSTPIGSTDTTPATDAAAAVANAVNAANAIPAVATTDQSTEPAALGKRSILLSARQTNTTDSIDVNDENDTFISNPNDSTDQSDAEVDDDASNPDNAEFAADSTAALTAAEAEGDEADFTFSTIIDYHNTFTLIPGDDGNLYAGAASIASQAGSALFAINDNAASMDDDDRVLHYYPDVMAAYGVSRIRMADITELPKTADMVVLRPYDVDENTSTPNILIAVDGKGNAFTPVLCDYEGGADSKLFLVTDSTGLSNLLLEKLRYTVTGGVVSECNPVAMIFGPTSATQ